MVLVRMLKEIFEKIFSSTPSEWEEWDREYVWHPFTRMWEWVEGENLLIVRGEGNYLIDSKGRKYFDGVSSLWVNIHGHNHPLLNKAIVEQMKKISHSTYLGLAHEAGSKFSKALVSFLPSPLSRIFFSDNGSCAVEVALKMSFQYWKCRGEERVYFLSLNNAYHGDTLGAVGAGGIALFHGIFGPIVVKSIKAPSPYCYRCELNLKRENCELECAQRIEKILKQNKGKLCALIIEPEVQAAGGIIVMPEGYMKRVAEICAENDVHLIYDEVATGFGRTGKMFAFEHSGTVPHFLCLAKGITGGYLPLAVTVTSNEVMEKFHSAPHENLKTFFHGHTYTANPLACACALQNLALMSEDGFWERIEKLCEKFKELLFHFFYHHRFVGDVRVKGLMGGVEIVKDRGTKESFPSQKRIGWRVCMKVRERGVIMRPLGDVLVFLPPLSSTEEEIEHFISSARWALDEVIKEV